MPQGTFSRHILAPLRWCRGGDLNSHVLRHTLLRRTRIPIPPPRQCANSTLFRRDYQLRSVLWDNLKKEFTTNILLPVGQSRRTRTVRVSHLASAHVVVTGIFPDGKISRPRLAVFALSKAQTKTSLRLGQTKNLPQGRFFNVCPPGRIIFPYGDGIGFASHFAPSTGLTTTSSTFSIPTRT